MILNSHERRAKNNTTQLFFVARNHRTWAANLRRGESHADGPEFTKGKADSQNWNYGKTVR